VRLDDYVPGATVRVYAENPDGGGGFDPPVIIATQKDFGYVFVPALIEDARVYLDQTLCGDESDPSIPKEEVQPDPGTPPTPTLDPTPIAGAEIVVFWGPGGAPNELVNGAVLTIEESGTKVGGQPTAWEGQQVGVSPPIDDTKTYDIIQELCDPSPPGTVTPEPCSSLKAPKIYPPLPGQNFIEVYDYHPGAQILVFSGGQEIGHSGPTIVHLNKTLVQGETLIVVQKLGNCVSSTAIQMDVDCNVGRNDTACGGDWPTFRQNNARNGWQPNAPKLANPDTIKKLVVRAEWSPGTMPRGFTASPIVYKNKVIIGGSNGRVYCLNEDLSAVLWQYPPGGGTLTSTYQYNSSSYGIASTAAIGLIDNELEVVVIGAPDQSVGAGLGSGRLFALDIANGNLVWASDEVAVLNGTNPGSFTELHEQLGYSSPLVYNNRVYVGIANHSDNPIQRGKVRAVELGSGNLIGGFKWEGVGGNESTANGRGGGVWNSPAGGYSGGVYFTTGNTRISGQGGEPSPNHGLSLLRVNENTGDIIWKLQPVPYDLDGDPDWAAGALVTNTSCGEVVLSTMKDGWAYGVDAGSGTPGTVPVRWQFPPTGTFDATTSNFFSPGDGTSHGDIRYLVPGAAQRDNYVTMTGGEEVVADVSKGFGRLHSINACFGNVRWLKNIPGVSPGADYQLGPPSISNGIIYVGTQQGRLIAIADPSVYPTANSICTDPDFDLADCVANGGDIVKDPIVLKDLNIGRGSMMRNEPVIANNRIYIATTGGWLVMIEPE
jgi:outer membrane protein assembly factor BamB